jgi:hypothetical protein
MTSFFERNEPSRFTFDRPVVTLTNRPEITLTDHPVVTLTNPPEITLTDHPVVTLTGRSESIENETFDYTKLKINTGAPNKKMNIIIESNSQEDFGVEQNTNHDTKYDTYHDTDQYSKQEIRADLESKKFLHKSVKSVRSDPNAYITNDNKWLKPKILFGVTLFNIGYFIYLMLYSTFVLRVWYDVETGIYIVAVICTIIYSFGLLMFFEKIFYYVLCKIFCKSRPSIITDKKFYYGIQNTVIVTAASSFIYSIMAVLLLNDYLLFAPWIFFVCADSVSRCNGNIYFNDGRTFFQFLFMRTP